MQSDRDKWKIGEAAITIKFYSDSTMKAIDRKINRMGMIGSVNRTTLILTVTVLIFLSLITYLSLFFSWQESQSQLRILVILAWGVGIINFIVIFARLGKPVTGRLEVAASHLETAINYSNESIVITDNEGIIQFVNPSFEKITGYTKEEAIGQKPNLLNSGLVPGHVFKSLWETALSGTVWEGTVINKKKNGEFYDEQLTVIPIQDSNNKTSNFIGIQRDVTDERRAIKQNYRMFKAMEQTAEGIIITDENWKIQYVNPALETISGFSKNEVMGQFLGILLLKDNKKELRKSIQEAVAERNESWRGRISNTKKDGNPLEVEISVSPIMNDKGRPQDYIIMLRDVSREVQMEAQLRHASKMEAIGTLAGGISHDFNNILTPILGYSSLLDDYFDEGTRQKKYVKIIEKSANRAKNLVSQILMFSRKIDGKKAPMDMRPLIKEVITLLKVALPKGVKIQTDIPTEEATIVGDSSLIHTMIMNLCVNAGHAMPSGGDIQINLGKVTFENHKVEESTVSGDFIKLSVLDSGKGIEKDVLPRIFEPFFTTKEVGTGTGLGLSMVYGIVKQHDGFLEVESQPGIGTQIFVYFPLHVEKAPLKDEKHPMDNSGSEHILVVDDEEYVGKLVQHFLVKWGYKVTNFLDSREAYEAFKSNPDDYDLMVIDQNMPGLSGNDLVQNIKTIRPELPMVMISGMGKLEGGVKSGKTDIDLMVQKPFSEADLLQSIRKVLDNEGQSIAKEAVSQSKNGIIKCTKNDCAKTMSLSGKIPIMV